MDRNTSSLPWPQKGVGVAPRRGAWIEIQGIEFTEPSRTVAPRRGAWIEISLHDFCFWQQGRSHPAGVRG